MSSIGSAVSLLLAVSDLAVVQSITKAINANLPKDGPLGTIRPSSAQLYARPRQYYSPTKEPRIEPQRVEHAQPSRTPGPDYYDAAHRDRPVPAAELTSYNQSCDALPDKATPGPFDPPWKHLPPICHPQEIIRINLIRPKVDLITKGTLLDLFI